MDQKAEIRSNIKNRIRLNIDPIYDEHCRIDGSNAVSLHTVLRWLKAIDSGGKRCLKVGKSVLVGQILQ